MRKKGSFFFGGYPFGCGFKMKPHQENPHFGGVPPNKDPLMARTFFGVSFELIYHPKEGTLKKDTMYISTCFEHSICVKPSAAGKCKPFRGLFHVLDAFVGIMVHPTNGWFTLEKTPIVLFGSV